MVRRIPIFGFLFKKKPLKRPSFSEEAHREPIIKLCNTTLRYQHDDVVNDVNLTIHRGETKVILGPSGVGKSTILKAILGLIKPHSGKIFVHGHDVTGLTDKEMVPIRLLMAMVFQNGALFDSMTVANNVSFRLRELNLASSEEIQRRTQEVLQFVGLQAAANLLPAELSGGMRKRVAIARALAPDPDIFLFDEPTVGLDPINYYNVEQLILKLKERSSRTLVIVTHDVGSAARLGDSVAMLFQGKFIFDGPVDQLKHSTDPRILEFLNPALAARHSSPKEKS